MNAQEFVIWLNGFLEASGKGGLETHQVDKIRQALDNVHEKPTINTIVPDYPRVSELKEMVPYNTICGCNPANGGSGICGCIMGNKLVPKTSKTNIYTTTSDNTKFNWQYASMTDDQLAKQILND